MQAFVCCKLHHSIEACLSATQLCTITGRNSPYKLRPATVSNLKLKPACVAGLQQGPSLDPSSQQGAVMPPRPALNSGSSQPGGFPNGLHQPRTSASQQSSSQPPAGNALRQPLGMAGVAPPAVPPGKPHAELVTDYQSLLADKGVSFGFQKLWRSFIAGSQSLLVLAKEQPCMLHARPAQAAVRAQTLETQHRPCSRRLHSDQSSNRHAPGCGGGSRDLA